MKKLALLMLVCAIFLTSPAYADPPNQSYLPWNMVIFSSQVVAHSYIQWDGGGWYSFFGAGTTFTDNGDGSVTAHIRGTEDDTVGAFNGYYLNSMHWVYTSYKDTDATYSNVVAIVYEAPLLTVALNSASAGTVTSDPSGIDCPGTSCQSRFSGSVSLTATPATGYGFAYWDDGVTCVVNNPLTVSISSATTVTAFFGAVPSQVLSPTVGQLGMVTSDTYCNALYQQGKWCFNQHGTGAHTVGGGVGSSDDSKAWDVNWNYPVYDSDNGKDVYSVESGTVAQLYAGSTNAGGTTGQVLIEHTTSNGKWWSGYLHLSNISVSPGDPVTSSTVIGKVSQTGIDNNHLHFVVYIGENAQGKLKSVDVPIIAR